MTGPSDNVLCITALAADKAGWPTGVFPLSLTVSDGTGVMDLFARSTLTIGSAQVAKVSLVVAPDTRPHAIASPLPAAFAQAFQSLQPLNIATALGALPAAELSGLIQALVSSLPVQTGDGAPVSSGQAFINKSGYVVIAQ